MLRLARTRTTVLLLGACALVLAARLPDRILNPQFYAEDAVFFGDAVCGGAATLLKPYLGYLLLVPRLCAWLGSYLPLAAVPAFFNGAALTIAVAVLARLFSRRQPLSPAPVLALAVVLLPHAEDVFLTMENIQWILSLGLLLLLISEDPGFARQRASDWATAVFAGLTGVFSILFFPLFAVRAWLRRTRESVILAAIVGGAACAQAACVLHGGGPLQTPTPAAFDPGLLAPLVGLRLAAHLVGGTWLPHASPFALGLWGIFAGGALAWFLGNSRLPRAVRTARNFLAAALVIQFAASVFRFQRLLPIMLSPEHLGRYFFTPEVIFMWLVAGDAATGGLRRLFSAAVLAAFFLTAVPWFRVQPLVDYHWHAYAALVRQGQRINVPVNPPGWFFYPCPEMKSARP